MTHTIEGPHTSILRIGTERRIAVHVGGQVAGERKVIGFSEGDWRRGRVRFTLTCMARGDKLLMAACCFWYAVECSLRLSGLPFAENSMAPFTVAHSSNGLLRPHVDLVRCPQSLSHLPGGVYSVVQDVCHPRNAPTISPAGEFTLPEGETRSRRV